MSKQTDLFSPASAVVAPTPAPWLVVDHHPEGFKSVEILGPQDPRSKYRHGRIHVVTMRGSANTADDTDAQVLADARLIAAAPELYAACCSALERVQHGEMCTPAECRCWRRYALAAIAKARGAPQCGPEWLTGGGHD